MDWPCKNRAALAEESKTHPVSPARKHFPWHAAAVIHEAACCALDSVIESISLDSLINESNPTAHGPHLGAFSSEIIDNHCHGIKMMHGEVPLPSQKAL